MPRVLVCGASVAGVTAAYWPARHGFSVTVAERADGPRRGGQAVDVRGTALNVFDRMGARTAVQQHSTATRDMSFVDAQGIELWRETSSTLSGGPIGSPDILASSSRSVARPTFLSSRIGRRKFTTNRHTPWRS
jgi:2-polyprenyl-6-methoxyphenol hydroxylase-like FAD-dependent oxidoreductase